MPESDRKQLEQARRADGRLPPGQSLTVKWPVLHEGSVLAEGSLDRVTSNQDVIDVYLGR